MHVPKSLQNKFLLRLSGMGRFLTNISRKVKYLAKLASHLQAVIQIRVLLEYPTTTRFQWRHLTNGPYTYTVSGGNGRVGYSKT